ncbi:hypothetical protein [Clostridium sp. AN503]|uniref:hypothetical protein n=1 Tax=Clostridium sp. AN503 TaxID=3160598 RepID=UPI00345824AA
MRKLIEKAKALAVPASTAVMLAVPTMSAWAAEAGADVVDFNTIAGEGIAKTVTIFGIILAAFAGGAVGIAASNVGVQYIIKKINGLRQVG